MKFFLVLFALFGLSMAGLKEDFQEILGVIPREEIKQIAHQYKDCSEVQQVVKYLQGEEWRKLVNEIAAKQEVKDFKDYLTQSGLDIEMVLQYIRNIIANIDTTGPSDDSCTLRQFVDAVKAKIPVDQLLEKITTKISEDGEFTAFIEKISSEKAYKLVESIRALPEVQRLAKVLKEMGIDVTKVLDMIYELLGWK